MYETGEPGEIFIKMAKEGSTLSGFMDGFALSVSIGLQYGVPLKALVDKFINTRFEPAGYTGHPAIPYAKSVLDYIARWLGGRFISPDYLTHSGETALPAAIVTATPAMLPAANATADDDPPSAQRGTASDVRRRAHLLRVRHAHDAQRRLLQVRKLRRHVRLQLDKSRRMDSAKGTVRRALCFCAESVSDG